MVCDDESDFDDSELDDSDDCSVADNNQLKFSIN